MSSIILSGPIGKPIRFLDGLPSMYVRYDVEENEEFLFYDKNAKYRAMTSEEHCVLFLGRSL